MRELSRTYVMGGFRVRAMTSASLAFGLAIHQLRRTPIINHDP